jgi:hypothetical protein
MSYLRKAAWLVAHPIKHFISGPVTGNRGGGEWSIVDGDTFYTRYDVGCYLDPLIPIRVLSLRCPERGQPGFSEAKQKAVDILTLSPLRLNLYEFDKSIERWLGDVWVLALDSDGLHEHLYAELMDDAGMGTRGGDAAHWRDGGRLLSSGRGAPRVRSLRYEPELGLPLINGRPY